MKNARLRQAVEPDYTLALGHAVYCFALAEWQVVSFCEKVKPGSVNECIEGKYTAGDVAKMFHNVVRNMPRSQFKARLQPISANFSKLVEVRNDIVHGKPCTSQYGAQRLSGKTVIEIKDLEHAADQFSQCQIELGASYFEWSGVART